MVTLLPHLWLFPAPRSNDTAFHPKPKGFSTSRRGNGYDVYWIKMIRRCRVWWPTNLTSHQPHSSLVLFGWCISCSSSSIDIVVAFVSDYNPSFYHLSELQGILGQTNNSLPVLLQKKTELTIVGYFEKNAINDDFQIDFSTHKKSRGLFTQETDGNNIWIQLNHYSKEVVGRKIYWMPKFYHIYCHGCRISSYDFHVILYEIPEFGFHHFSKRFKESNGWPGYQLNKPKWITELHGKKCSTDLDTIFTALNSASAANLYFQRRLDFCLQRSRSRLLFGSLIYSFAWEIVSCVISSFSTLLYVIFQYLHDVCCGFMFLEPILSKVLKNTSKIINIRCHEILYWPIFLENYYFRLQSSVEYAEKDSSRKHSMWLRIVFDIFMGNLIGLPLIINAEICIFWFSSFSAAITNSLLRYGCVWLMGAPAGFKLNTELAGVFGFISLHIIQSWSTLCFFVKCILVYLVQGIAIFGMVFGITFTAAAITDLVFIVALHISFLRWLISHVYRYQVEALSSLCHLFRGKKWNPIRRRYDNYDYTMEQHVVGSLLFTPVLLLLPTTSIFYIFFTILDTCAGLINIMEVLIFIILTTPYSDILLWTIGRRRFSSGVWFEILSCRKSDSGFLNRDLSSEPTDTTSPTCSSVLFIHGISLNLGEIVIPRYRKVVAEVFSKSSAAAPILGLVTGRRLPSTSGLVLPYSLPWMSVPPTVYWRICRDSILGRPSSIP